jgi:hypothetical protein
MLMPRRNRSGGGIHNPVLPSLEEFRQSTNITGLFSFIAGRGANMMRVDMALDEWWKRHMNATDDQKMNLLYLLSKECKRWLSLKENKTSTNAERRRRQVQSLGQKAYLKMLALSPAIGKAYNHFEFRKKEHGALIPEVPTCSLSRGYDLERRYYEMHRKEKAIAASQLSGITFDNFKRGIRQGVAGGMQFDRTYMELAEKNFEDISLAEFEILSVQQSSAEVTYLNKIRRLKHWAQISEGLFLDISGQPIHMTHRQGGAHNIIRQIYAMDKYGNIFVQPDYLRPGFGSNISGYEEQWFNHSSFMAGGDIVCAGCMVIFDGHLRSIDNNSGHYKPNTEHLLAAVQFLHDGEGVTFEDCVIVDFSRGKPPREFTYNRFVDSLGNGNPDWTVADDRRVGLTLS